jgi:hypothetical protein
MVPTPNPHPPSSSQPCQNELHTPKRYNVKWKKMWLSLTLSLGAVFFLMFLTHLASDGWEDHDYKAFIIIPSLACGLALIVALLSRVNGVTLTKTELIGKSVWGIKTRIQLLDIARVYESKNEHVSMHGTSRHEGLDTIVVQSKSGATIQIYNNTENLEEILSVVTKYIPIDQNRPDELKPLGPRIYGSHREHPKINPEIAHRQAKDITLQIPSQNLNIKNPTHAEAILAICNLSWNSKEDACVNLVRDRSHLLQIIATPADRFHLEYCEEDIRWESKDFVELDTTLKIAESYLDTTPDWKSLIPWVPDTEK